mgnify:CR=1 FL=1
MMIATLLASSANGAITTYTSLSGFTTAIASLSGDRFDEDFESFTSDTSYAASAVPLDGFSVSAFGSASGSAYQIDVSPFNNSGKQNVDGTNYLVGNNLFNTRGYQFSFDEPIMAFGVDIDDVENANTALLLSDGTTFGLSNGFRGFISDIPITYVRSTGGGTGDSVGFDNFTIVTQIPEPSSALIFCLAAMGFVGRRRLRK